MNNNVLPCITIVCPLNDYRMSRLRHGARSEEQGAKSKEQRKKKKEKRKKRKEKCIEFMNY